MKFNLHFYIDILAKISSVLQNIMTSKVETNQQSTVRFPVENDCPSLI